MGFGSSLLSFLSNPLYVFGTLVFIRVAYYIIRVFKVNGTPCRSPARLDGKTVIITGGNTGIGKETALGLAQRGAKVYIACRNINKGQLALEEIRDQSGNKDIYLMKLDLASCKSIREFVAEYCKKEDKLHVLLLNAGVMMTPNKKTAEGFEYQFGINHLGHFLLTYLLLDMLKECAPSRVVVVASLAHFPGSLDFKDMQWSKRYNPYLSYCRSKLANVMFARELGKRVGESGVTVVSLHPGTVYTEITRDLFTGWLYFLTVRKLWQSYCTGESSGNEIGTISLQRTVLTFPDACPCKAHCRQPLYKGQLSYSQGVQRIHLYSR